MRNLLLLLFFLFLTVQINAQSIKDTTRICFLTLKDGSQVKGKALNINDKEIRILTENLGELTILQEKIAKIEFKTKNEGFEPTQSSSSYKNRTRYVFGPSSFMLKKGESYYQNTYIILNTYNYGITDYFTMGGGVELISLIAGKPLFVFTPKIGKKISENVRVSAGALAFVPVGWGIGLKSVGIIYSTATLGNEDKNITAGLGWGTALGSNVETKFSDPILTVSGVYRFAKKVAFLTENWLSPKNLEYSVFSYGFRVMSNSISFDFGFFNSIHNEMPLPIGIPYISVAVHFGK